MCTKDRRVARPPREGGGDDRRQRCCARRNRKRKVTANAARMRPGSRAPPGDETAEHALFRIAMARLYGNRPFVGSMLRNWG